MAVILRFVAHILFACVFFISTANARVGVSLASGYGVADIVPIRVGLLKSWDKYWWQDSPWKVTGYFEGSYYYLPGNAGPEPDSNDKLSAYALAIVGKMIRQEPWVGSVHPFADLGFGASYLTRKEIGGRELGIHFQFEDRLSLGLKFGGRGQYEFGYRALHFSNAYLGPKNHGINLHMLFVNYWF